MVTELVGVGYREGLKHLVYEIEMMVDAAIRYDRLRKGTSEILSKRVFLEAALLHARNLIEFLAVAHDKGDYLTPGHFKNGWDYDSQKELEGELRALNQRVSHLSKRRLDDNATQIATDVFRQVLRGCRMFHTFICDCDDSRCDLGLALERTVTASSSSVIFEEVVEVAPFSTSDSRMGGGGFDDPLRLGSTEVDDVLT